jgi:hypothetical protein
MLQEDVRNGCYQCPLCLCNLLEDFADFDFVLVTDQECAAIFDVLALFILP